MAMTISVAIPSSPDAANTPPSTDGAQTPVSPSAVQTLALPPPADSTPAAPTKDAAPGQAKRKPSRRANTAERRATHNAVERQRRETLNSRFLDLAALLPNLSQIRRPSKSSIVNSSIAHIQASRRHRMIAARELRLLKLEADALRRELNEWRDRSGLPRVEEPVRGEAFQMILSGEVEVVSAGPIEEEGDNDDYGEGFPEDDYNHHPLMPGNDSEMAAASLLAKGGPDVTPFAHNVPSNAPHGGLNIQTMLPRQPHGAPSPMIVHSPTAVSFENPAMASMYEPHAMHAGPNAPFWNGNPMMHRPGNEDNKWGNIYAAHHGQHHHLQGPQQFTPPTSSHGHGGNTATARRHAPDPSSSRWSYVRQPR
ncbi:hypothetical protein K474DRAFT_83533 [Panus rudis PR-1116 ss-1]|nr:hypothetical protein K474DRAFT_83533 [Panus rudis PR-1116 ss-1]